MTDGLGYGDLTDGPPAPVGPTAGDPTAVMGRRILAWVLDLLLFLAVAVGVFAALAERVDVPAGFSRDPCEQLQELAPDRAATCIDIDDQVFITSDTDAGIQTLTSLGYLAFFVIVQGVTGGSPGKLLTGLRVVDAQGQRAGVGRSALRTLLWAIDGAPWIAPLVGFITGLTSTGHRRVGDLAAGTWVVAKRSVGQPPARSTPSFDPTPPASWTPPSPASWSPPATPAPGPEPTEAEPPPPQWDQARGTYIQWDPRQRVWLQWDTVVQRWKPIDR